MERVVRKFESWQAADDADFEYYAQLSGNEKLRILLELIAANNPEDGGNAASRAHLPGGVCGAGLNNRSDF